jgi:hypothetical protein
LLEEQQSWPAGIFRPGRHEAKWVFIAIARRVFKDGPAVSAILGIAVFR